VKKIDELEKKLKKALKTTERLDLLKVLVSMKEVKGRFGVNLHIHTNASFSVFSSPTEAVWRAYKEGLKIFGINDHYSIAGHDEFGKACEIAGIPGVFSIEAIAMDEELKEGEVCVNDPSNPGRIYLCGKGVTKNLKSGSVEDNNLKQMLNAIGKRNRTMTDKVIAFIKHETGYKDFTWERVARLSPKGNITERHIAQAIAEWIVEKDESQWLTKKIIGEKATHLDRGAFQNLIRSKLLKAGRPCYVEEENDSFITLPRMINLFLAFGAIPTYPILANPVTYFERDIPPLLDGLADFRIYCVEVIPYRNTRDRLSTVVHAAKERWIPVFTGSEHNTKEERPLLDELSSDEEFYPYFLESAIVLLGHQNASKEGKKGFVDASGAPTVKDSKERFLTFMEMGKRHVPGSS
jgi:hypothetical protein